MFLRDNYSIFQGPRFNLACWFTIGLVFTWTVGFFFAEVFQCVPFSVNWTGWGNMPGKCIDVNRMMLAQAWSDVATNLLIILLPLGCVSTQLFHICGLLCLHHIRYTNFKCRFGKRWEWPLYSYLEHCKLPDSESASDANNR